MTAYLPPLVSATPPLTPRESGSGKIVGDGVKVRTLLPHAYI
jgi:hypothetical protein